MERGVPETGIPNLVLTGVGFGIIMGLVSIFILKRKESKQEK